MSIAVKAHARACSVTVTAEHALGAYPRGKQPTHGLVTLRHRHSGDCAPAPVFRECAA